MAQHSCYWFSTAPTKHNITSGLVRNADVLIIGGGIAGVSLLYQLINAGITNTYLVEESTIGFHASGRSNGQLLLRGSKAFSQMPEADGIEYLDFIAENNRRFLNGLRNVRFDTDLRDTGGLRLASTPEEFLELEREASFILKHRGLACPILDRKEVAAMLPQTEFFGGMYVPTEAIFNPYKVINGLRELIEEKGPRVLTNCCVTGIVKTDDGFSVSIRHRGTIKAKKIVYCTSAYTSELLPQLSDSLISYRGQIIATEFLSDEMIQSLPQMSMICNNGSEYFRLHGGRLLVGGMRHAVRGNQIGITEDGEISPAVYEKLRSFAVSVFPVIKDIKFTHTWSGIMCSTPDQMPLIGQVPDRENEFILCGFNNYGYSHALHGSMIIKDLITQKQSTHPGVRLFDPKRFVNV